MDCCVASVSEAHRPHWSLQVGSCLVFDKREKTETFCSNLETAEKKEKTVWDHWGVLKCKKKVVKEDGQWNDMERGV